MSQSSTPTPSLRFQGAQPHVKRNIDGPLLVMRDGALHWLTLWERVCFVFGWHDAYTLERKHWDKP